MVDPNVSSRTQQPAFSPTHVKAPTMAELLVSRTSIAPRPSGYTDYTNVNIADQILTGSLTIITLFKQVANLIPHAGPLSQVLGATKELIGVINEMGDNKDDCEHLVERVLLFIKSLVEELSQMNVPLQDGTPTAARLYALLL
jgi:hypothetical protein